MIELLRRRRSIRRYTGEPVSREAQGLLIEALLRSPSSRSIDPWEFVVVDDRELLTRLSLAKEHGSAFLKQAALGIVVCADTTKSDVWIEDCSIASVLVQTVALSLGLGSCWIQIRNRRHDPRTTAEAYVRELLGLPDHIAVESIVSIGHPDEARAPLPGDRLHYAKVRRNHYSVAYFE
ncbi:MAG TPA: nitroreductase family protein [Desulfuromonadaceae bacterium]